MTSIWRLLAESWPLAWPRTRLRAAIGDDALVALERYRVIREEPLLPGDAFPCRCHAARGCAMRLVEEDGLVAVCELAPAQCADERVEEDDAVRCHLDAASLAPVLQELLRVPRRSAERVRGVYPLGERRMGGVEVRFVLAPRPGPWVAEGWLERSVDEDPDRVLVALVFDRPSVPPAAPRRIRGTWVEWVALAEALSLEGPTLDLAELWLAVAPGADLGPELWPRYAFTADPARGRYTYAGHALPLDRKPLEERLLLELLRGEGRWVPRRDLLLALWPEEFSSRSRQPIDPIALDRRLRQLKSALSAVFAELPAVPGAAVDPIENLRTRGDLEGGYRIAVAPERVLWLSQQSA